MNVSLNGFNETMLTFSCNEEIMQGAPVKMGENKTVTACAQGDKPVGFVVAARMGVAGVMMSGYFTKSYTGEMALGHQNIVANNDGGVEINENGIPVIVTDFDDVSGIVGFIM